MKWNEKLYCDPPKAKKMFKKYQCSIKGGLCSVGYR
jgi:hypothetical protein